MNDCANSDLLDHEKVRSRLRRMSDEALQRFGAAARYMCSPKANLGEAPRPNYVLQLEEAVAEWKSRHPSNRQHLSHGCPESIF